MPPNPKMCFENSVRSHVTKFVDENKDRNVDLEPNFGNGETNMVSLQRNHRRQGSAGRSAAIVQTEARYSYQLDRYAKNAMLIFHNENEPSSDVEAVKRTFESFRFEVHVHHNLTGDEAIDVCNAFFRRDFTECGCAAIVVISSANGDGSFAFQDRPLHNEDLLKFLEKGCSPTLDSKPKLLITEANNMAVKQTHTLDIERKPDVFELYLPNTKRRYPPLPSGDTANYSLNLLCQKMENLWDEKNFVEIVYNVLEEDFSPLIGADYIESVPIGLVSQLCKQLWLWQPT